MVLVEVVNKELDIAAVGIDLAGVQSRPTGWCLMNGRLQANTCLLYTDAEVVTKTIACKPGVVAIDAPLALPLRRDSLEKGSDVHLRECDRGLLRIGIKFFPLTLGPMRQLTERGIRLKRHFEKDGFVVIETYPGAAQDILGIPRKGRGLNKLSQGLRSMGIEGLDQNMSGDELDAITCALVGIMYLREDYRALGIPEEMLMILPP